jgi:pimeloyl-ACP methyl ester carboxylesterase
VVFLHGLGCERTQFAPQLAGLDPRLRLLSVDLPGHGESASFHVGRYGVVPVAEAVSVDLTERGHQDIMLIGHSAGGLVALQIAVTLPKLVRGVTLLDTNIALTEAELRANRVRSVESDNDEWRQYFMASMTEAWGEDAARAV